MRRHRPGLQPAPPPIARSPRPSPLRDFHAYDRGRAGIVAIGSVAWIAGNLPVTQRRLVEAWAELHRFELLAKGLALQNGRAASKIDPLR